MGFVCDGVDVGAGVNETFARGGFREEFQAGFRVDDFVGGPARVGVVVEYYVG